MIVGCDPVEEKEYLDLTEKTQLGAYISLAVVASTPEPDGGGGKLQVGDECPDCLGRGMVGDGTIENKCSRCNGTGKIQQGDPDVAAIVNDFNETVMTNADVAEWISADSPKACLCDPACPDCDGKCDPCDCLFCLPRKDPLPSPTEPETVRRNGQLYRKEGDMLVPVEEVKDVRTKSIGDNTTSNRRPFRSFQNWGKVWDSPVAIGCS
jgi:RecJ-like exonuclease